MHDSPATPHHQQNTLLDFFEDGLDFDSPADVPTSGGTISADVPGRENGHVATSSNKQVRSQFVAQPAISYQPRTWPDR